jgi:DNA polymerase
MVVGEAPGREENRSGRPFVGKSGERLWLCLDKLVGRKRAEVYVTNLVKHRPPGNRRPRISEIHACTVWLDRELDLVKPQVIITLGEKAGRAFDPGLHLGLDHGKAQPITHKGTTYTLVTMYHPAASLHKPGLWPIIVEDWTKLKGQLTLQLEPESKYELLSSSEVLAWLN